jgi:multidrug efflux pump subunit AcrA (membrane-fusion protein)
VLTAPTGGTIASLNGVVGQWISGGPTSSASSSSSTSTSSSTTGSAFITLTDLGTPQIDASISEADIGKIAPGQRVNFSVTAYPGRTFTGTVRAIQPAGTTSSNVVTYTVPISVDPTEVQLLPGMTATVSIVTQSATDVVTVPNAAVSNGAVRVLRDGAPVSVPVQTGITDGISTQIVAGLAAGDQVITGTSAAAGTSTSTSAGSGTRSILTGSGAAVGGPPR